MPYSQDKYTRASRRGRCFLNVAILSAYYLFCSSASSYADLASPPGPLVRDVTTTITQYPPHAALGGFDNDVNTLFHSALGTAAGSVTLTVEHPITLTSLRFVAQRDTEGQTLLNRLPCFISIRCLADREGHGGSTPLISPLIDVASGSATLSLHRYRLTGRTFTVYLRSRADCISFSECHLRGVSADRRGTVGLVMQAAGAAILLAICAAAALRGRSRLPSPLHPYLAIPFRTLTWARAFACFASLLKTTITPSVGHGVACGAVACAALAYFATGLHISGIDCTGIQGGDGLWFLATLKSAVNDFRWWRLADFGAPLFSDMRDFASPDFLHLFVTVTLSTVFGGVERAFWLYYIASFSITYVISFVAYRRLSIAVPIAHVLAFGYAFLPYHVIRLGHYALSMYFTLPLAVLATASLTTLPVSLATGDHVFSQKRKYLRVGTLRSWISIVAVDCLMAVGGAYYCVWYLLLLAYAAVFNLVSSAPPRQRIINCSRTCLHVGITIGVFAFATFPFRSIIDELGPNAEGVSKRLVLESDVYATSLAFMITPSIQSRLSQVLGKTSFPPFSTILPPGESIGAYIGMPGSLGLLMSCIAILCYVQRKPRDTCSTTCADAMSRFLAPLTLYLFMWTTFGGFNAVFANLVTPQIRCWNRLSVLLSFVAAGVFGIAISRTLELVRRHTLAEVYSIVLTLVVTTLVSCIAISQLHPWTNAEGAALRRTIDQQSREYFASIAARSVHRGRPMILQLPYMAHPEAASPEGIAHYAYFLPYLHSDGMRFSFGGCRGRPAGEVYRLITSHAPPKMLAVARKLGFTGILICEPSIYQELLEGIATGLGDIEPLMSVDGKWAYFDLETSCHTETLTDEAILDIAAGDI